MVGVVSANLSATGCAEKFDIAVNTEQLAKLVTGIYVSFMRLFNIAVKQRKLFIKGTV